MKKCTLALGCFWKPEENFKNKPGIVQTEVGYAGGKSPEVTYEEVCTGKTGHAEVVRLTFDEGVITFKKILDLFFKMHDPTQKDMQFPDVGTQYRSEIFYENNEQKKEAGEVLNEINKNFNGKIQTNISKLTNYCKAEEYHQKFLEKKKRMKHLVSTDWLENNLDKVRVLDGSWHLPSSNRNALNEFHSAHIKNSNFFDIDRNSNEDSNLPHMLPTKDVWEKIISKFGIKNSDHIVIYDNSDLISSCRVWYSFLYFNHDPNLVSVLDGGLRKWLKEKKQTTKEVKKFSRSSYSAYENLHLVLNKRQIVKNIEKKSFQLVDARSRERFLGLQPETRKELKSGNIEGSKNLPFTDLINEDDYTFKKKEKLISIFETNKVDPNKNIAFTCGSGITACVLGLTNSIISGRKPVVYDGSWAEYGINRK